MLSTPALAQPSEPVDAPTQQAQPLLVFMIDVAEDLDIARQTVEALRLELAGVPAKVIKEPVFLASGALELRVRRASVLAKTHGAIAVMWLDEQEDGNLAVFVFDPRRAAPIRRTVPRSEGPGAVENQVDAVAMISRASVQALVDGQELVSETEPEPEPEPEPQVTPLRTPHQQPRRVTPTPQPERKYGYARFSTSYLGNNYAPSVPWQNGVHLALSWQVRRGFYTGVGYYASGPMGVEHNLAGAQFVTGLIRRHPIDIHVGYQHLWGKIGLEAELAAVLDPVTKEFTVYCDEDVAGPDECESVNTTMPFQISLDSVNTAYGVAPRLRFVFKPAANIVLHGGAGIDVFTRSNHELVCDDPGTPCYPLRELLLAPRIVRFVLVAGFQFLI